MTDLNDPQATNAVADTTLPRWVRRRSHGPRGVVGLTVSRAREGPGGRKVRCFITGTRPVDFLLTNMEITHYG